MLAVALVLSGLAALVHVYIFWLESVAFDRPASRRVFGVRSEEDAAVLAPLFLNQGFYNLFLALGVAAGIGLTAAGSRPAGLALVVFATASMLGAAVVLVLSNRALWWGALVQGAAPGLALLALGLRLLTGS